MTPRDELERRRGVWEILVGLVWNAKLGSEDEARYVGWLWGNEYRIRELEYDGKRW